MLEHIALAGGHRVSPSTSAVPDPSSSSRTDMGDSRHSYRFVVPELVAAGTGSPTSTSAAVATRAPAGPATAVPTSRPTWSPSSGTSAVPPSSSDSRSAVARPRSPQPTLPTSSRASSSSPPSPARSRSTSAGSSASKKPATRHRSGTSQLLKVMTTGSLPGGSPTWTSPSPRSPPTGAGARPHRGDPAAARADGGPPRDDEDLPGRRRRPAGDVRCPVLVVEGSADPDWATPLPRDAASWPTCPPGSANSPSSRAPATTRTPRTPGAVTELLLRSSTAPSPPPPRRRPCLGPDSTPPSSPRPQQPSPTRPGSRR